MFAEFVVSIYLRFELNLKYVKSVLQIVDKLLFGIDLGIKIHNIFS